MTESQKASDRINAVIVDVTRIGPRNDRQAALMQVVQDATAELDRDDLVWLIFKLAAYIETDNAGGGTRPPVPGAEYRE